MSKRYSVFAAATPALSFPFQATDVVLVTRAGITYQIAPSSIRLLGPVVYITPVTGATITAIAGQGVFGITPAGTIATLTMVLPPTPVDEQIFEAQTTQTISALTVQGAAGDSIVNGSPGVLAANGGISYRYRLSNTTWYPR